MINQKKMPNSWVRKKIKDIGYSITGGTPKKNNPDFFGDDILWVKPENLSNDPEKPIINETKEKLSFLGGKKVRAVPKGSTLVCCIGSIGKLGIANEELRTNQQINSVKFDNNVIIDKLGYYSCFYHKKEFIRNASKAVVPILSKSRFDNVEITYPTDKKEQQLIVEKLDVVADAIKYRSKCIEHTEELIPSIFHDMFGDPIKNEKGWEQIELGNKKYLSIEDGDRGSNYPKKEEFFENGYCLFLNAKNVTDKGFVFKEKQFISKEKHELLRKGTLQKNDLVVMTRGTIGNICLYSNDIPFDTIRINSGMVILRVTEKINSNFLLYAFRDNYTKLQIRNLTTGVAIPQLPIHIMSKIKIPLPPLTLQEEFAEKAREIEAYLESQRKEHTYFKELFESLLQHAFDGSLTAKFREKEQLNG